MKHSFLKIMGGRLVAVCMLCIPFLSHPAYAAGTASPALSAQSAILIDAQTGQVLYALNPYRLEYPASITKIMTAYLAIAYGWHNRVPVSTQAQDQQGSSCYLRAGQDYPMPAVATAMLMVSGNDAAWAIAQSVSGNEVRFVRLMNQTARRWHAPGIHFANPNGLPNPHHVVTAAGMAVIARHVWANPVFRHTIMTAVSTLPPDPQPRVYFNQNQLLSRYPGDLGGKIGYTLEADETYVGAARRGHLELIEVVLHQTPVNFWTDTSGLFTWGFQHFHVVPVVRSRQNLGTVRIAHQTLALQAGQTVQAAALRGTRPVVRWKITWRPHVFRQALPAHARVGTARIFVNGTAIGSTSVDLVRAFVPPATISWHRYGPVFLAVFSTGFFLYRRRISSRRTS
ncbi:MAG: D-alanyl-D-alanine carboxypeptidase [Firmicutes bacterium]|nr:D-alanyl-D-alanine carboxypeptidase [Bacillota bacterium]